MDKVAAEFERVAKSLRDLTREELVRLIITQRRQYGDALMKAAAHLRGLELLDEALGLERLQAIYGLADREAMIPSATMPAFMTPARSSTLSARPIVPVKQRHRGDRAVMLEAVLKRGPLSRGEFIELGIPAGSIDHHLRRLTASGKLTRDDSRPYRYEAKRAPLRSVG